MVSLKDKLALKQQLGDGLITITEYQQQLGGLLQAAPETEVKGAASWDEASTTTVKGAVIDNILGNGGPIAPKINEIATFDNVMTELYKIQNGDKNIGFLDDDTNKIVLNAQPEQWPKTIVEEAGPTVLSAGNDAAEAIKQGTDTLKKYWPAIAAGGVALLLITALK